MNPLVSILIPAYNAEPWIADTIEPALAQTWPRKEIVVVGSTDRTLAVARRFVSSQVLVTAKENQGAAATRNKAFSLCQGDYIQWLDANEGHNGYPEVFLNLRWVGVALLAVVVGTGYVTVVGGFRRDPDTVRLRLGYFVAGVAHNVTESGFRTMNPVWIVFLWAIIAAPKAPVGRVALEEVCFRRLGKRRWFYGGVAANRSQTGDGLLRRTRKEQCLAHHSLERQGERPMLTDADRREITRAYLRESADVKRRTAEACEDAIIAAADLIVRAFRADAKVLLCGNGGSAADCQHMAAEFVSRLSKSFERPGLPAIALTTDSSFLTAFANDFGFDGVFERQVQALGRPGDVLIAISTSGNSPNVIQAVRRARSHDLRSVVLTGAHGELASLGDVAILVPSTDTQHIQEAHLAIEHLICWLVERELFPSPAAVYARGDGL